MNAIVPFQFETHQIRTVADEQGEPWFVATDVAEVLGYRNAPDMTRLLDDDEAATHNLRIRSENGVEQDREMTIISESGLYACILKSRKPEAKRFRKWVTAEVLPSIRKTGRYAIPAEPTISPSQQRQLQNAIAERFPEGKHRPYAWSRFNNHFSLGSYKQLPGSQVDEAMAYIAQMPGGSTDTDRERLAREALQFGRFLLSFDHRGLMMLLEVPPLARMITDEEMTKLVGEPGEFKRELLPTLIENAARRLKG